MKDTISIPSEDIPYVPQGWIIYRSPHLTNALVEPMNEAQLKRTIEAKKVIEMYNRKNIA